MKVFTTGLNQDYDLVTGSVTQAASLPPQAFSTARTLLPTINAILGIGNDYTVQGLSGYTNTFLYNTATQSWSQTGSLAVVRFGAADLVTLHDGSALAMGGLFTRTCETYSPSTGLWTLTGSLAVERNGFETAVLLTGQVVSAEPVLARWVCQGCSKGNLMVFSLRVAAGAVCRRIC